MAQEDLLVKLYQLPEYHSGSFSFEGIKIKKAMPFEMSFIVEFARNFSEAWANECEKSFSNAPVSCFVAYKKQKIVGFSCYNTTAPGFFGPTGVNENYRGKGIGKALLLEALYSLKYAGHAYAFIGRAGPSQFYQNTVGATIIEGSSPGIYQDLITNQ